MIQILDSFNYRGKNPNFGRDQFATLADMKAFSDDYVDEGHIAYCVATGFHYVWKGSNTVDTNTGKWRKFSSVELEQTTGNSTTNGMSQNAITVELNKRPIAQDIATFEQETETSVIVVNVHGNSTTNAMSQKKVTDDYNELSGDISDLETEVDALNSSKADKTGTYDNFTSGFSKAIVPKKSDATVELGASFIARSTAGDTSIPDVGVTQITLISGNTELVDEGAELAHFNPTGGFLSLGYNQVQIDDTQVLDGMTIDSNGVLKTGSAGDVVVAVRCIACEAGSGKNNGYVVELANSTTLTRVAYRATIPVVDQSGTILNASAHGNSTSYLPAARGFLLVAINGDVNDLCVHLAWSGYNDGIFSAPTSVEPLELPLKSWGLGTYERLVQITDSTVRLYSAGKIITGPEFDAAVADYETKKVIAIYLADSDATPAGFTNLAAKLKQSVEDAGCTPGEIVFGLTDGDDKPACIMQFSADDDVETLFDIIKDDILADDNVIYYRVAEQYTDFNLSMSANNSDFGTEWFLGTSIAPAAVNIAYGVNWVDLWRNLYAHVNDVLEPVVAKALSGLDARINAIADKIKNGFESLKVSRLEITNALKIWLTEDNSKKPEIVILKSITTAPAGTPAVGDKYFDSTAKTIFVAYQSGANVVWTNTGAAPLSTVYYKFGTSYYKWASNDLTQESTALTPLVAPDFDGQIYRDTVFGKAWMAFGVANAASFKAMVD